MASPFPPRCAAALLCKHVDVDDDRLACIHGVHDLILFEQLPGCTDLTLFVQLTNGRGRSSLLAVVPGEQESLYERDVEVCFSDPAETLNIAMELADVPFPRPGEYFIELYADQSPVASIPVRVQLES